MAYRDIDKFKNAYRSGLEQSLGYKHFRLPEDFREASVTHFDAPGGVGDIDSQDLKAKWNSAILAEYTELERYHSRFFSLDSNTIQGGVDTDAVRWAADPAEPNFCFDPRTAQQLSDWRLASGHPVHSALSVRGRRETHNEYCEYRIVFRSDQNDNLRPKRVIFTTELREYWTTLATHAPDRLRHASRDALGREVEWSELYGPGISDPTALFEAERLALFATWVAGGGSDRQLLQAGVPTHPIGALNNENALFMSHQINGLDDLLYIVLYGAHPYARRDAGGWIRATKDEIFNKSHFDESSPPIQLACRHADPAAALGAAGQAFEGRQIGFANPLGMYLLGFAWKDFLVDGEPIPDEWVRFSRGASEKLHQRLEFGPGDDDPHFLDEITVGDEEVPLKGGFQIAQRIEVGPWLRIGQANAVTDAEYQRFEVQKLDAPYNCAQAPVCRRLRRIREEYEESKSAEV